MESILGYGELVFNFQKFSQDNSFLRCFFSQKQQKGIFDSKIRKFR